MVDTNRLKGAMIIAGYSQATLAKELGISKNTLNAKLNGKAKITTDEANNLCNILGINKDSDKCEIFLM